jgi:hypothetical protein
VLVASRHLFAIACAAAAAVLAAAVPARGDPMPPEDPVAGAKSTQQWREHMAHEDRERKLRYDRDRMKDHRAVVKFLVATRARYDRARTRAAVLSMQKRLPPTIDGVRKRITKIDHWGTNSNLLDDYDAMLKALSDTYPAARITALDGERALLDAQRADFDRRLQHINNWLAEATEAEDE